MLPSGLHILSSHRQMDFAWEGNVSQDELSEAGQDGADLASASIHDRQATKIAFHCAGGSRGEDELPRIGFRKEARVIL